MNKQLEVAPIDSLPDKVETNPIQSVQPAELLRIAINNGADLDRLEKLMDMQERWEANEARKAYHVALSAFKTESLKLVKNKHVSFLTSKGMTEYDHASLDSVCDTVSAAMSKHGLSFTWSTEQLEQGLVKVTCHLTHAMGHSESASLTAAHDTSGGKNPIQGLGSAVTYLQRYTLRAITGTAEADQDDDGKAAHQQPQITEEQALQIDALIKENELNMDRFIKWLKTSMKVNAIKDITQQSYPDVMNQIQKSIKRNAA